jgi:tetratricopeptide (TPR) repeat protein
MLLLCRPFRLSCLALLPVLLLGLMLPTTVAAQDVSKENFLAERYDVAATIEPASQSLSAVAKVEFRARDASSIVRVELHPNLNVSSVKDAAGKSLSADRDQLNPMLLVVNLPSAVAAGSTVSLTFTYTGLLANEENSPVPRVRLASIYKDGAYLLLPSRWFPLTAYPTNRYTGTFRLTVPDTFAVAGTGKTSSPSPVAAKSAAEGGRLLYTFECKEAQPNGSFVAGPLQLNAKQAEGLDVNVYAPPADSKNAQDFANAVARSVTAFSDLFGGLPDPSFTVVEMPDGGLREFSGPGLLVLSHRAWDPKINDRVIARLVASQWWGNQVLPATRGDVWISDGLARYSEALYAEQNAGKEAGLRAVDDFAVGALMNEEAAPISQAARLTPFTSDYRSVVVNKGAMQFHMLRAQLGDVAFKSLLHKFYSTYAGKQATNAEFEQLAVQQMQAATKPGQEPPNLGAFFAQWLNSTGVPDFKIEYVVYRTPKGFRVVGKISQPLDTFSMPIQLRIETEGNPETKTVDVTGTESTFTVETFGRPKPGGIKIDPNNLILKGNTGLRARAAIARGEELAESGRYYDAIQQYQKALNIQPGRPLANFRMGEAFFYQKNYQAAANAFRESLQGVPEPSEKWTEVWGHVYLGMIFDLLGQRERAVNEYSKAKQTNDNTGGAQEALDRYLKKPYSEGGAQAASAAKPTGEAAPPAADDGRPHLKKPNP